MSPSDQFRSISLLVLSGVGVNVGDDGPDLSFVMAVAMLEYVEFISSL